MWIVLSYNRFLIFKSSPNLVVWTKFKQESPTFFYDEYSHSNKGVF